MKLTKDKETILIYGVGVIVIIVVLLVLWKQIKELVTGVKDTISGTSSAEVEKATKNVETNTKTLPVNTKRLYFTLDSYKKGADNLHYIMSKAGNFTSPVSMTAIKPIITTYARKRDDWNQFKKAFGVRDGKDLSQYMRDKLAGSALPFSDTASIGKVNDIIEARNKILAVKDKMTLI